MVRLPQSATPAPVVSVIMANYCGAAHIASALDSVRAQTLADIEIIVSDDRSTDASTEIVRQAMRSDPRVQLIVAEANRGPAAARNLALERVRGEWIAIVDSDDIIHPERFERLLLYARRFEADIIADDLLFFADTGPALTATLLGDRAASGPMNLSAEDFIRSNVFGSGLPPLGYLKPVFKRTTLGLLRYDEGLRIGEDYDFLLRVLLAGARCFLVPELFYLYRRHSRSISHRLSEASVNAMVQSQAVFIKDHGPFDSSVGRLLASRLASLGRAAAFERLVTAIKTRQFGRASRVMVSHPMLAPSLFRSMSDHFASRLTREAKIQRPQSPIVFSAGPLGRSMFEAIRGAFTLGDDARLIRVPSYVRPDALNPSDNTARNLWTDLAKMGVGPGPEFVSCGAAGIYAAAFLPKRVIAGAVLDDITEIDLLLSVGLADPPPLLVSNAVYATNRLPSAAGQFGDYHYIPALPQHRGPSMQTPLDAESA